MLPEALPPRTLERAGLQGLSSCSPDVEPWRQGRGPLLLLLEDRWPGAWQGPSFSSWQPCLRHQVGGQDAGLSPPATRTYGAPVPAWAALNPRDMATLVPCTHMALPHTCTQVCTVRQPRAFWGRREQRPLAPPYFTHTRRPLSGAWPTSWLPPAAQ